MNLKEMLLKKISNQDSCINDFLNCKDIENREIRTCKIEVRLTEEEKQILSAMANLNRTTCSELVRQVVFVKYLNDLIKAL